MKLSEILEQAVQQSGAPRVETDALGVTRLLINDKYLIHLRSSPDEKFFYLYSKAGELPQAGKKDTICEMLLEANLFGEDTGNAMFSVHRETRSIILMKIFDASNTTLESYQRDFQLFINTLAYWKEKLAGGIVDGSKQPAETDVLNLMGRKDKKIFFA